ncbi:tripartite tricarboxylate transporter substrate binding protein [Roseococcus sp. SYP-B2431]|uniref:Bug family tripartite tricarboxylate transporter substrate binding protein n=1 Tax=Roseococcus sp. SYP-B2431 TaxID=2496640 RepID=UPI00103B346F|nr:tripartite tricarboxylate transporter substrate binding protein [Roseococcus sp. SYP-B2431]TCH98228.1 tripartite tricarboxylate transporter substrate binding protein [Roseococcus sp. SYP-B2431]
MIHPSRRALGLGAAALPMTARAQAAWPTRPVRLVAAFAAGGGVDLLARIVGAQFERGFGQPFPVDNRTGAGGQVGTDVVAKAPADGYTLLATSSAAHGVAPGLYPNQPYDAIRDFTHIGLIASGPIAFLVNARSPYRTLADFIAAARAKGAPMTFGSGGTGSLAHLTGEMVHRRLGIEMTHVSYRGSAPAQADLVARNIDAILDNLSTHAALIRAGTLRVLAVASRERTPGAPDAPTFAELGYPDLVAAAWFGLCGPAGMAPPLVARLNAALREATAKPEVQAQIEQLGLRAEGGMSPAEYGAFVAGEVARWREVVRIAGVRIE